MSYASSSNQRNNKGGKELRFLVCRSWRVRKSVLQDMCITWLADYGKVTADVNAALPASELSGAVHPEFHFSQILYLYMVLEFIR
jgi:hypothetical protein